MYKILLVWFGLGIALTGSAQTITVKDKLTQQPLESVIIYSSSLGITLLTDRTGQADISSLRNADKLQVRLVGYNTEFVAYRQLAQQAYTVHLTQGNISLDAVVVSATRWQQAAREVPGKVITISQTDVQLQQPQTTADLLGQSGEVFVQKSQLGGGSPMIRGFATNRVLLVVDGVRMNTAIFRSGNLQNVISLDPFSIERTEVLFGPGSVLYGSDAIGGVMSFYTLSPRLATGEGALVKANATTRWSSASHEKTGHLDFNIGLKKWAFLTSATFSDFGDLKMGSRGPVAYLKPEYVLREQGQDVVVQNPDPERQVQTGYSQFNLMQKVRYSPTENLELHYGLHYSTTSDVPRYDRHLVYRNGQLRSAEWYYGPQEWLLNSLNLRHSASGGIYDKASLHLAHQLFGESRHNRDFNRTTRYNRIEKVNAWSANLDFEKQLGEQQVLSYGAEAVLNKVNSSGTDEDISNGSRIPGPPRYPDNSTWSSYAAFFTYRYNITPKLSLLAGGRYNYFALRAAFDKAFYDFPFEDADLDAGAVTGSAGVVYSPDQTWQLSTNLSTGFRSPNIDDVGKLFDSAPGLVLVPNPALRPEYAYNLEAGMAKTFGSFLKLDATAFYTYLDDALVRRDFTLNGQSSIVYEGQQSQVQAVQNAAFATVWGLQAGAEARLPAGFGISTRYNLQRGIEELDNGDTAPLRHAGPTFGVTHLTYTRKKFKADVYAVYNGEVSNANLAPEEQEKPYLYATDAAGAPFAPAWYTLNLKLLYQFSQHLQFSAGLENITDLRYRPYSSGIAAPSRNFIFSVRASL